MGKRGDVDSSGGRGSRQAGVSVQDDSASQLGQAGATALPTPTPLSPFCYTLASSYPQRKPFSFSLAYLTSTDEIPGTEGRPTLH